MDINKPMTLLLIEDDVSECKAYEDYIQTCDGACLVGISDSSEEGMQYVKSHVPEGIILDLELNKGKGDGLEFLTNLCRSKLDFRPLVIVITNIFSDIIYNHAHENGADMVFYKKKSDYSAERVINSFLLLRKALHDKNIYETNDYTKNIDTPAKRRSRISEKLNIEFDLIGISHNLKGRRYLFDGILYILLDKNCEDQSALEYLAKVNFLSNSSISRAMQTAINKAWKMSPIEELQIHYTAKVDHKTGVPTPTQFIYYYVEKLKKYI